MIVMRRRGGTDWGMVASWAGLVAMCVGAAVLVALIIGAVVGVW